jgi:hypothetical protein
LYEDINGNTEAPTGADRRLLERTFLAKYQGGFGFELTRILCFYNYSHSLKTLTDSISIYLVCTIFWTLLDSLMYR